MKFTIHERSVAPNLLAINNGQVEPVPEMVEGEIKAEIAEVGAADVQAEGAETLPGLIGSKIRARRDKLGLKQNDLARRLDVSFQAVSKWERGENAPEISQLPGLARELKVSVDWLLGRELKAFARECYLFEGLSDGDLHYLLDFFECEYHAAGQTIYQPGDEPHEALYLIESGTVEIGKDGESLNTVGAGELFSDYSLFAGGACTTSATTTAETCLHRLSAKNLRRYTEQYPDQANLILWNELKKVANFFRATE